MGTEQQRTRQTSMAAGLAAGVSPRHVDAHVPEAHPRILKRGRVLGPLYTSLYVLLSL